MAAILYCVATPIGNLGDMSSRALDTLRSVDRIYAEDTRVTRKLLTHFGIQNGLSSLHDHNEQGRVQQVIAELQQGQSIALVSDAGTPLISDPGYHLVCDVAAAGFQIVPIPGASAVITALSVAGLPTDRFVFEGFLPAKPAGRRKHLESLHRETRTLVFYESSHRIADLLADMQSVLGAEREVVLARELTKLYESIYRGSVAELQATIQQDDNMRKGEFVVMVAGAEVQTDDEQTSLDTDALLTTLLDELPVKQAAKIAAKLTGQGKNQLYRRAMELNNN